MMCSRSILMAVPQQTSRTEAGIVRDSTCTALASGVGHLPYVNDPLAVEAMACLRSLHAVQQLGMNSIQVETDSLLLMQVV